MKVWIFKLEENGKRLWVEPIQGHPLPNGWKSAGIDRKHGIDVTAELVDALFPKDDLVIAWRAAAVFPKALRTPEFLAPCFWPRAAADGGSKYEPVSVRQSSDISFLHTVLADIPGTPLKVATMAATHRLKGPRTAVVDIFKLFGTQSFSRAAIGWTSSPSRQDAARIYEAVIRRQHKHAIVSGSEDPIFAPESELSFGNAWTKGELEEAMAALASMLPDTQGPEIAVQIEISSTASSAIVCNTTFESQQPRLTLAIGRISKAILDAAKPRGTRMVRHKNALVRSNFIRGNWKLQFVRSAESGHEILAAKDRLASLLAKATGRAHGSCLDDVQSCADEMARLAAGRAGKFGPI